eukprot:CAMPEP_0184682466 /NCGR_PEP_ID=MMETSP0312-20130426/7338_1 /TAXON_ID=31354 /ORGANISM="Compsopogon coeruleus, Strain SAG 36.94" /LENGTH=348 /DNA_ID=CAMNT_0027134155 /DNA_START=115 /DNA_END=1161 /DNA_ORIENTATION=-
MTSTGLVGDDVNHMAGDGEVMRMREFWSQARCGDVLDVVELVRGGERSEKPVTIPSGMSTFEACSVLAKHGFHSALVEDENEPGKFLGVFSYRTLVDFVVREFGELEHPPSSATLSVLAKAQHADRKVIDAINPHIETVEPDAELWEAILIFRRGIHRVSVIRKDHREPGVVSGQLCGTLTQRDALKFLIDHFADPAVQDGLARTLTDWNLGLSRVIAVPEHWKTLRALEVMRMYDLSSVPILDINGRVIGDFSLTDLKYIMKKEDLRLFWVPSRQAAIAIRNNFTYLKDHQGKDPYPFFPIQRDRTMLLAAQRMHATHASRLWVVDANNKPVGVVSITDILHALSSS